MKQAILILAASFFLLAGCKKEDKLPTPTHHGANTFACKIDGKVFSVSGIKDRAITEGISLTGGGGRYQKVSAKKNKIYFSIGFPFPITDIPRTTSLGNLEYFRSLVIIEEEAGTILTPANLYETNTIDTGIITIDKLTNAYMSGTFNFKASNGNGGTINVSEGQFDIEL